MQGKPSGRRRRENHVPQLLKSPSSRLRPRTLTNWKDGWRMLSVALMVIPSVLPWAVRRERLRSRSWRWAHAFHNWTYWSESNVLSRGETLGWLKRSSAPATASSIGRALWRQNEPKNKKTEEEGKKNKTKQKNFSRDFTETQQIIGGIQAESKCLCCVRLVFELE